MKSTKTHQTLKHRSRSSIVRFQSLVLHYWSEHGRHDLPWRKTTNPYRIMVSEIMLQQTQVPRVIEKYREFLKAFPTISDLANVPLKDVLALWSGLGYNRRAKFLHEAAKMVLKEYNGRMPKTAEELEYLPGIGPYTARAIAAFAYNTKSTFIETNIRAVFLHHFFPKEENIHDRDLLPLIEKASEGMDARTWYGALMDYGSHLKQTTGNASRRSTHYVKQTTFKGSGRQLRGAVIRELLQETQTVLSIAKKVARTKEEVLQILIQLQQEGMIQKHGTRFSIVD